VVLNGADLFCLQFFPKMTIGAAAMYESVWWRRVASTWDFLVFNPLVDLETWWFPLLVMCGIAAGVFKWYTWQQRRRRLKQSHSGRDLDV
jgi:hypothetical protein